MVNTSRRDFFKRILGITVTGATATGLLVAADTAQPACFGTRSAPPSPVTKENALNTHSNIFTSEAESNGTKILLHGARHTRNHISKNFDAIEDLVAGCKLLALEYGPGQARAGGYFDSISAIAYEHGKTVVDVNPETSRGFGLDVFSGLAGGLLASHGYNKLTTGESQSSDELSRCELIKQSLKIATGLYAWYGSIASVIIKVVLAGTLPKVRVGNIGVIDNFSIGHIVDQRNVGMAECLIELSKNPPEDGDYILFSSGAYHTGGIKAYLDYPATLAAKKALYQASGLDFLFARNADMIYYTPSDFNSWEVREVKL